MAHTLPNDAVNFISFNQDFSCISVGTTKGYNLFNCNPFGKCFAKVDGSIGIIEMLFCTSLVAVVGVGDQPHLSPRRLKIVNTKRKTNICELTFPTCILKVKLNRKRLVVLLEEQIYIYDISNMELLYTIETSPNLHATCALSPSSDNCYLAYPSPAPQSSSPFAFPAQAPATTFPARSGDVVIFDALALRPVNVIEAHKSPLSAVAFNSDGTLLATASDKGTVVRVFSVPTATKLYQFRRGTYPSQIFSMNFNMGSTLLAVSSATETVHIFRLARPGNIQATQYDTHPESVVVTKHDDDPDPSLLPRLATRTAAVTELDAVAATKPPRIGIAHTPLAPGTAVASILRTGSRRLGKQVAGAAATYLPAAVAELWQPQRDFAYVRAPKNGSATKTVVGFSKDSMRLYTVTGDGYFCQYGIDLARGGECAMLQQYSLFDNSET